MKRRRKEVRVDAVSNHKPTVRAPTREQRNPWSLGDLPPAQAVRPLTESTRVFLPSLPAGTTKERLQAAAQTEHRSSLVRRTKQILVSKQLEANSGSPCTTTHSPHTPEPNKRSRRMALAQPPRT